MGTHPGNGAARGRRRPDYRRELERLSAADRFTENLPWRETFLIRLTLPHYTYIFRAFGAIMEEHLAEFLRFLPEGLEPFPVADLRAAATDLHYLQGYLAGRGRAEFEDAGLTPGQLALVRLAGQTALGLGPLLERLEAALPGVGEG